MRTTGPRPTRRRTRLPHLDHTIPHLVHTHAEDFEDDWTSADEDEAAAFDLMGGPTAAPFPQQLPPEASPPGAADPLGPEPGAHCAGGSSGGGGMGDGGARAAAVAAGAAAGAGGTRRWGSGAPTQAELDQVGDKEMG